MIEQHRHEREYSPWLPILVASLGIIFSILFWDILLHTDTTIHFLDTISLTLPWVILIVGCCLSLIVSLMIYLLQITRERSQLIVTLNQKFDKEFSDRIHAEESKQRLEKELLQGQKLQAIGTLAGGIAHDFNNILYAIIGYVEMSQEDVEKNTLLYNNLGRVLTAAHRGQELISRILTFSRRQHHEFKPLCLDETIEGVLSLLRPTIPASVTIQYENKKPDKNFVMGNQTQLHQIIVNLINNAVDAMDSEGLVRIEIENVHGNESLLEEFPKAENISYCKIKLKDTGHGMEQSTIERIFEPFFTTKEVGKGTGLGLSTVHAIVEEHKGEIKVTSQLGHGTTFTILLPEYKVKEQMDGKNTIS